MLNDYIHAAIAQATYEFLTDDAIFYGEIEGFQGVYATGITVEICRKELIEVLEEWILLSVARHLPLPEIEGISLPNYTEKRAAQV